jgi:predicted PurR-regulated permease PerM
VDRPEDDVRTLPVHRIELTLLTAGLIVLAVAAAFVLADLLQAAQRPLGWFVACALVAALIRPVVDALDQLVPRWLALVVTVLGLALLLAGARAGFAATVADNVDTLRQAAPEAAADIEADNQWARDFRLEERVTRFVEDLDERLGQSAQLRSSATTASTYVVTGILMVFLVVYGPRMVDGALRQVRRDDRRRRWAAIGRRSVHAWRVYVLATLAQVTVIAVVLWLLFWTVDLPAPFVLALTAAAIGAIPHIGLLVGGLPAILFAVATTEPERIAAVVIAIVALQALEALVLRPRIDGHSLRVGPALPTIVVLIGWQLYGLGGAIYGVVVLIGLLALADAAASDDADDGDLAPAVS